MLFPNDLISALTLGLCEGMGMTIGWVRVSGIFPVSGTLKENIFSSIDSMPFQVEEGKSPFSLFYSGFPVVCLDLLLAK